MVPFSVLEGAASSLELADTQSFLTTLAQLKAGSEHKLAFNWSGPLFIARAPGRLDVMGGIADYSGSLVLQMAIREACHVALQLQTPEAVPLMRGVSLHSEAGSERAALFEAPVAELFPSGAPLDYEEAQAYFKSKPETSWAAYVAGCLLVLAREGPNGELDGKAVSVAEVLSSHSVSILVSSQVPEGKGVSSSASVEVATMSALIGALGVKLDGRTLAILCQKVENLVVGAPCGIMDQMASALGQPGQLLALLCQPAEVQGHVPLPPQVAVWGVDSGIRHSVGGSDYGSVRVGAYMGLRYCSSRGQPTSDTCGSVPPALGDGYLTTLSPSQLEGPSGYGSVMPPAVKGSDFLEQYGTHYDTVTKVDPGKHYEVRTPASHPIHEHSRVCAFRQLLGCVRPEGDAGAACGPSDEAQVLLGELMLQSHASYSACGLGSSGTDRLVQLVREEMAASRAAGKPLALYGAKITGGGSGGTVCILGTAAPEGQAAVERVVGKYASEGGTGVGSVKVFEGSSMGAVAFGHLKVVLT